MFDHGMNLSLGAALLWLTWVSSLMLLGVGGLTGELHFDEAALACGGVATALTVMRENARTRQVVRAAARESDRMRVI